MLVTCSVEGCDRPKSAARGMCSSHYHRFLRYGDPLADPRAEAHELSLTPEGTAERFWERVDKRGPDDCWPWTGQRNSGGYGVFKVPTDDGRVILTTASRAVWLVVHGSLPPKHLFACHRCDTPSCVNPAHLFLGDQFANMQDAVAKGRDRPHGRYVTHCKRGHEFTPENTYLYPRTGNRECRACKWARRAEKAESA